MLERHTKINPALITRAKMLNEYMDHKKGYRTFLARELHVSLFTVNEIIKSGFDYNAYRKQITAYGDAQKARRAGAMPTPSPEYAVKDERDYQFNIIADRLGEIGMAIRDLVVAWNARPIVEESL